MTNREKEVLTLIGLHGDFDYALPDDDATVEALQSLFHQGLVNSDNEPDRGFHLSNEGRRGRHPKH